MNEKLNEVKERAIIEHLEMIDLAIKGCKDKYLLSELLKAKSNALIALSNIK